MDLYSRKRVNRLGKEINCWKALQIMIIIIMLGVCITCCAITTTATDRACLIAAISSSIISGWCLILVRSFVFYPLKKKYIHMASILNNEEEPVWITGRILKIEEKVQIPKSIEIEKVQIVLEDNSEIKVSIMANESKRVLSEGCIYKLKTIRNYITEVENA